MEKTKKWLEKKRWANGHLICPAFVIKLPCGCTRTKEEPQFTIKREVNNWYHDKGESRCKLLFD